MARILICHIPKDGGLARDLGALLMGRGHYVSFDGEPDMPKDDRSQRLRQFEAVIVVWTEASAQSPGLTEVAAETMPLNILVPVRSETLSPHALPLKFRKLNMFGPRDIDGLSRLVVRLSQAQTQLREMSAREVQRDAYAPTPEPVYQQRPQPQPQVSLRPPAHHQTQPQAFPRPQAQPHTPHPPQQLSLSHAPLQERARAFPPAEPQKPQLPVFVKLRPPVTPDPVQVAQPQVPPQPQEPTPVPPRQERPSFPPRMQKPAEQPPTPAPAPAPRSTAAPLPPFVTRRLTSKDAPAETAPPKTGVVPPPVAEARRPTASSLAPAQPTVTSPPLAPQAARAANPAPQPQAQERGHERAWKALADELNGLVNPAPAGAPPPITRPHAPFGRAPLMGRSTAPKPEPMPQPDPAPRSDASQLSSLRPQSTVPPPLPSKDSMALGSPSFSAVAMAQHLARLVEAGLLLIYIPEVTSLGEPITTEVRLGWEVLEEAQGPAASAPERLLIDTLSVSLISEGPGFTIERQSERTQFVGPRYHDHKVAQASGRWAWLVTPNSKGQFDLIVRISALVRDRSGVPTPVALPDRRYSIAIQGREAQAR